MTTKEFSVLEDIVLAMKMGVAYPEFDFLVDEYHLAGGVDSLNGFIIWLDEKNDEYRELTKEPYGK